MQILMKSDSIVVQAGFVNSQDISIYFSKNVDSVFFFPVKWRNSIELFIMIRKKLTQVIYPQQQIISHTIGRKKEENHDNHNLSGRITLIKIHVRRAAGRGYSYFHL